MKKSFLLAGTVLALTSVMTVSYAAVNSFSDAATFAPWFSDSVEKMQHHEIMTGYADGSFKAENPVNRAEFAVILDRFATAIGSPLQTGPTMCTMQFVYGLNITLQDNSGQPLENATISVAGLEEGGFESMGENGQYSGLGEQAGYFTFTISKEGHTSHTETIKLEKDACHVIPQARTITLIKI